MQDEPLVSVITPSFNQGRYIQATIESVLQQDYTHIQYLVIDGGSTDNTVELLKTCADPRLVWISEKDSGQSSALNKGLRRAQGDYLTYLNSDDLLLPGVISQIVNHFQQNPQIDLVFGDGKYIDPNNKTLIAYQSAPFDLAACVLDAQKFAQPGTFWRRKVTEKIGFFDENLHYRMDYDYWLRAAFAGFRLQYLPGERAAYRLHDESKTVVRRTVFARDWDVIVHRAFERNDLPPEIAVLKDEALERSDWALTKLAWLEKRYDDARPKLGHYLSGQRKGRRLLAALMLFDTYAHTRLTLGLTALLFRLTKLDLLENQPLA